MPKMNRRTMATFNLPIRGLCRAGADKNLEVAGLNFTHARLLPIGWLSTNRAAESSWPLLTPYILSSQNMHKSVLDSSALCHTQIMYTELPWVHVESADSRIPYRPCNALISSSLLNWLSMPLGYIFRICYPKVISMDISFSFAWSFDWKIYIHYI